MEMVESLEHINNKLVMEYGRFETAFPNYRVVFSDDQTEKRWVTHSAEGFELIHPEVQERWKYRNYIQGQYILERFLEVLPGVESDLVEPFSYEPVWVFKDAFGRPLPPRFFVCKFVIEEVHKASKKAVGVKYTDPEDDPKIAREVKLERIKALERELFGNESEVADALHYREGVVVPFKEFKDGRDELSNSSGFNKKEDNKGTD